MTAYARFIGLEGSFPATEMERLVFASGHGERGMIVPLIWKHHPSVTDGLTLRCRSGTESVNATTGGAPG